MMAMSKPVPSAQLGCVMKCDICDSVEDVNSFCNNCLQNLCDNCKKHHQKFPSLRSHDIGSIGDGRRIHQSKDLLCSDHGEILNYSCKTCSMNVCPKCLSNHFKHDLLDIDEEGRRMKEELEKMLDSKSILLEDIRESRDRMFQHKVKFDSEEDIISKMDAEFDLIIRLKTELKEAILRKNARDREKIQEHSDILQNFELKLEGIITRTKDDLHNYSGLSLIEFAQYELEKFNAIETPITETSQSRSSLKLSLEHLSKLDDIAELIRNDIGQVLFSEDLVILSSFRLKSNIWDIECEKEDKVWVSCDGEREVKKVDCDGIVHQRIQMIPNSIFLAKGQNGDIFVTSCNALPLETDIRKFDSAGNIYRFARLTDFDVIYNIAFDNHGLLFCHVGQSNVNFILKLDVKGETKWERELGNQCFSVSSITFSPQNICYIALGTEICVIRNDGQILRSKVWDSKLGKLGPIQFEKNGFLLAGTNTGTVHILTKDFDVVKSYKPYILMNSYIKTFACDSNNNLWIGNDKGLVCVSKFTYYS